MRQDRFEKLFTFLLALPDAEFDFRRWVNRPPEEHTCGTVCCAGGWLPRVDPDNWEWKCLNGNDSELVPGLKKGCGHTDCPSWDINGQLTAYFDITEDLAEALFSPTACEESADECAHYEEPHGFCDIPYDEYKSMTPTLWVERAKRIIAKVPSETP